MNGEAEVVTDETLSFIQRSRRLLVILSPNYVLRGTQALLEFKAGLENMASKGTIKVILVQYKPIKKSKVKELRQAKAVLTVIKWKGEKSHYPAGRCPLCVESQAAHPVSRKLHKLSLQEAEARCTVWDTCATIVRMHKDITEAIFDFIQKSRKMIVVLSPEYLLEKSISLLEFKLGLLCQNNIATKLVVVEYQPLPRAHPSVQQLKESVAFVVWKGEKSKHLGSKFWKALRLALPLQSLSTCGNAVWNESSSSHSDTSLDQAQKKRSRLKGPPSKAKAVPVRRGPASLPRRKTKPQPSKPFLACRCCVASSSEKRQPKSPGQAVAKPKQEMPCQRPLLGDSVVAHLQKNGKKHPLEPQGAALGLQQFADVSNNNDFYVL
ncbi:hypothetical protein E2320_022622 [Naja naja]|nr:hypothetical protein E2320_022622 [Naja naja]